MSLSSLVLAPPLPALVSLLVGFGLFGLGERLADFLDLEGEAPVRSLAVLPVMGVVSTLVFAMSVTQSLSLTALRAAALGIAVTGCPRTARWLIHAPWSRYGAALGKATPPVLVALGVYLAWSLRPVSATDASMYHLAVPVENLREGGLWEHPDFYFAPLAGVGEQLNLLGLAAGTDSLGAFLQWLGFVLLLRALLAGLRHQENGLVVVLSVVAMPLLAHHETLSPKFQLLPSAGLAVVLLVGIDTSRRLTRPTLAVLTSALAVVVACKYNYLVTGAVVFVAVALRAYRDGMLAPLIRLCSLGFALFPAPFYAKNLFLHRDPLYPALTAILTGDDSEKLSKTSNLPDLFPVDLVVPLHGLHRFDLVLGLGLLGVVVLVVQRRDRGPREALSVAAAALVSMALLAPGGPRFFMDVLFFVVVGMALSSATSLAPRIFAAALGLQLAATVVFVLLVSSVQVPGVLSADLRRRALEHAAVDYSESRWLETVLDGPGTIARPRVGVRVFLDRRSYSYGFIDDLLARDPLEGSSVLDELDLRYLVVQQGVNDDVSNRLKPYFEELVASSPVFPVATSNPFKDRAGYQVEVYARTP